MGSCFLGAIRSKGPRKCVGTKGQIAPSPTPTTSCFPSLILRYSELSVSLSVCLPLSGCPSVCLLNPPSLSVCLSVCLSASLSLSVSLCLCLCVSVRHGHLTQVCLSVGLFLSLSVSVCVPLCLSVTAVCLSRTPDTGLSVCLSLVPLSFWYSDLFRLSRSLPTQPPSPADFLPRVYLPSSFVIISFISHLMKEAKHPTEREKTKTSSPPVLCAVQRRLEHFPGNTDERQYSALTTRHCSPDTGCLPCTAMPRDPCVRDHRGPSK